MDEAIEQKTRRFPFGRNWRRFLSSIDNQRIEQARTSLLTLLDMRDLVGKRFLDVGCGSGLFSLAAAGSGASVFSIDYDPEAVRCAATLKERFADEDADWRIVEASILDQDFVREIGEFDIVYAWGVLHHTGEMWKALENTSLAVRSGGRLCVAIYNDQGVLSRFWVGVKRFYNRGPVGRYATLILFVPLFFALSVVSGVVRHGNPTARFRNYPDRRGMSIYRDWIDWIGGYPFETARPEEIVKFFRERGFELNTFRTTNSHGCNEFVFSRS